eukprot:c2005_g1_i1 orf=2-1228(+)
MYAKCGTIEDAHRIFNNMPERNVFTWNTMILAFINAGQTWNALCLFGSLVAGGANANEVTFITVIRACTSLEALEQGAIVHAYLIIDGFEPTVSTCNALLDMHVKCGRLEDAVRVFEGMTTHDVSTWTLMISGHIKHARSLIALEYFSGLLVDGLVPDKVAFVTVLRACAISENAQAGNQVHALLLEMFFEIDTFVGDTLVDMHAKCGSMQDAQKVFDNLPTMTVVSRNALLAGYVKQELTEEVFILFQRMQHESFNANEITFISILSACVTARDLKRGMAVHDYAVQTGMELSLMVGNALASMYANCGSILHAQVVFERMRQRDLVSWNLMISGLAKHKHAKEALSLFQRMGASGVKPDEVTFVGALNAVAANQNLEQGRILYGWVIESGFNLNLFIDNSLVDMYAK